MIMAPLGALTATPSTSMLTCSSLMPSRRLAARFVEAVAVLDVVLELVPVGRHEAMHGPRGGVAERADRLALDVVGDADQHVDGVPTPLAREDPLQGAVQPARAV